MSNLKIFSRPQIAAFFAIIVLIMSLMTAQLWAGDEQKAKESDKMVRVLMKTSLGDITIDLNQTKAPISVENFLTYVDEGYYEGVIFHRVIGTFMIQGGGLSADMQKKKTHDPIKNEWENGLKNKRGSIAMARTPAPNSATSQFFINVVDNASLDQPNGGAAYAVFGQVVEGMDVVDKIKKVKTAVHPSGMRDVPVEPVIIERVVRISDKGEEIKKEKAKPAEGE